MNPSAIAATVTGGNPAVRAGSAPTSPAEATTPTSHNASVHSASVHSASAHNAPATDGATQAAPMGGVHNLTMAKAINEGMRAALAADPNVMLMGEDIGALGGVFRVTDGLQASFGEDRVVDTPLAESGIVGTAIGLAMGGFRPVCEIQFDGFVFPAFDQITTQLAKLRYRSGGRISLPVVIRIPFGGGIGAVEHHSESPEALFAHTAGLRVVSPSTPHDAYVMMQEAIASHDPVIFFEPKRRYWDKGQVDLSRGPYAAALRHGDSAPDAAAPESASTPVGATHVPTVREADLTSLNSARVVRAGTDATIVAYGSTVPVALAAADAAGCSVEVIDLRTISPLDVDAVAASVRKTGRCVVVHEAPTFLGTGAEVAARISEECFYHLQAPVLRVGGFHTPYPVARLEHEYLPSPDRVLAALDQSFGY